MIIEKLLDANDLTESEKQISQYILDKNNDLSLNYIPNFRLSA